MSSTRQQKVARLLQKELGNIFQERSRSGFAGKMITVTTVRITPDLGLARIYLSIFPLGKDEDFMETIRDKTGSLRFELGNRIRHQVRQIPELVFYRDDSLDYLDNIEKLLKK